jgi:hypothetical protein
MVYYVPMEQPKLSERRVALTMPSEELEALDAYCADMRRHTGDPYPRVEIVRQAIREFISARTPT